MTIKEERCVHMLADLLELPGKPPPPSAAPPPAPVKQPCSAASPSSGTGANASAPPANPSKRQTSSWAPCRSAGTSSPATSIVEIRAKFPWKSDRLLLTPEEVLKRCDENTIGVIVTLGVTFTLQFEPVHAISLALDKLEAETGLHIPIHVDGASGAFLAPFTSPI